MNKFRVLVLAISGVIAVATLAYAAGTTSDYLYIKPGGGGTPPGNNEIAFENSGTIDFRSDGTVTSDGSLYLGGNTLVEMLSISSVNVSSLNNDINLYSGNSIGVFADNGIQIESTLTTIEGPLNLDDAVLYHSENSSPASGGSVTPDAFRYNQLLIQMPSGNITINAPSNSVQGAELLVRIRQDGTGSRTVTWNSAYRFSTSFPNTLSTGAYKTDYFRFVYNSVASKWDCISAAKGF